MEVAAEFVFSRNAFRKILHCLLGNFNSCNKSKIIFFFLPQLKNQASLPRWQTKRRLSFILGHPIIEVNAPFVPISIGIRMCELTDFNIIQNRLIQAAHPVVLGTLFQFVCVLLIISHFYLFLTSQCRYLKKSRKRPQSTKIRSPVTDSVNSRFLVLFY